MKRQVLFVQVYLAFCLIAFAKGAVEYFPRGEANPQVLSLTSDSSASLPSTGRETYGDSSNSTVNFNDGSKYVKDEHQTNGSFSGRQVGALTGIFRNRFPNVDAANTFRPVYSTVWPVMRNPDFSGLVTTFESCTASNGQGGACMSQRACNRYGGTPSSTSCGLGSVCCIVTVTACTGGTVLINNTYFQSPGRSLSSSSCSLAIRLNKFFPEQKLSICQVRLDLINFKIAQPSTVNAQCSIDSFQAGGALNTAPVICGDNDNQHMYLHVPPSDSTPTDLRLNFKFGALETSRSWNIKITMIPCAATYKAPSECLQYFTSMSGSITSFNWKDVAPTMRILANQDYSICFRTEIVNNKRAKRMCLSECTVSGLPNGGANNAFSISTTDGQSQVGACQSIYVGFVNSFASTTITLRNGVALVNPFNDKYCGSNLHPGYSRTETVAVCSTTRPFEVYFKTPVSWATQNMGFCLNYLQHST